MSIEDNVRTVKAFFAAMGGGDKQALLALSAEDIEWIVPGEGWPLAGTHRGHAGLANLLQTASKELETSFPVPRFDSPLKVNLSGYLEAQTDIESGEFQ